MRKLNIGLSEEQRAGVIELLNHDLSNAYLLLIKTKKYHWDVVGPQFRSLHQLWEEHYQALTENIDALAERVRALGGYPIGTAEGFLKYASINDRNIQAICSCCSIKPVKKSAVPSSLNSSPHCSTCRRRLRITSSWSSTKRDTISVAKGKSPICSLIEAYFRKPSAVPIG